jgi:hypothetical protein
MNAPLAETTAVYAPETRPFSREQGDPIAQPNQGSASGTENLQQIANPGADYSTEEMPQPAIPTSAEDRTATIGTETPVTQPRSNPTPAKQASGGRKAAPAVVALGVIVLAVGAYYLAGPRGLIGSPETQASNQPVDTASPAASAQPSVQPTIAVEKEQPTPQPSPTNADVITPSKPSNDAEAKSKSQQTRGEEKSVAQATLDKNSAGGTGAAEHNVNQGISYMSSGKYQEALQEFEYVKKLDPGNKNVYYLIGQTYHKMNQLDQALNAYRQCTSGVYASVALSNVKMLEKRLGRVN